MGKTEEDIRRKLMKHSVWRIGTIIAMLQIMGIL